MIRKHKLLFFTGLFGIVTCIPLISTSDEITLGDVIFPFFLLTFWILYFIVFFTIAIIVRKKYKNTLTLAVNSFITVIIILSIGFTKFAYANYQYEKSKRMYIEIKDQKEKRIFKSKIDSLTLEINKNKNNASAFVLRGLTYRIAGNWGQSVNNYLKAIAIDSNNFDAHTEFAYSLSTCGQWTKALQHFEIAHQIDSTKEWVLSEIERCKRMSEIKGN